MLKRTSFWKYLYVLFFFWPHPCQVEVLGQESNPHHSSNPSHCSGNTGSFTFCSRQGGEGITSWISTFLIRRTIASLETPPSDASLQPHWPEMCFMAPLGYRGPWKVGVSAWHLRPSKIRFLLASKKGKMDIGPTTTECTKTVIELVLSEKSSMFCCSLYSRTGVIWQLLNECFL